MRVDWDTTWSEMAQVIARRSLCIRSQVGAVIVSSDNRVVSVGYNGPPAGFNHSETCDHWCPVGSVTALGIGCGYSLDCTIHAEVNAVIRADFRDMQRGTIYGTRTPCKDCAKVIAGSGVARAVFPILDIDQQYEPHAIVDFLCGADIEVIARYDTSKR